MKLEATREEMLERFRLYGEMFCTCYELCDGDDPADLDEFKIDYDTDICETLGLDPDEGYMVEMPDETEDVVLQGIEIGDGDMVMIYVEGAKYPYLLPAIFTPSKTLQRVNDLLQRYAKEQLRQLRIDFKED